MNNFFVTAIGTDSGKTLVSAILCEALGADYWKPVQCGEPRDIDYIREKVSNTNTKIHDETYFLKTPASPHMAARIENKEINLDDFVLPPTRNALVVEGAGGLLVPFNNYNNMIDLASHLNLEIVLVSNYYLGSINHTLMSVEILKQSGINVKGIIFNGERNEDSRSIILARSGFPCLLDINQEKTITPSIVRDYAGKLNIIQNV